MRASICFAALTEAMACSGSFVTTANTGTSGTMSTGSASTGTGTAIGDGGLMYGSPCTPTASADPCAITGYQCSTVASGAGGAGTCVLPTNTAVCLSPGPGCAEDGGVSLSCTAGFADKDGNPQSLCVTPCTKSADCAIPNMICVNITAGVDRCFFDYCDFEVDARVITFQGPFFNVCNAAGSNDGQCLSSGGGTFAVCYQTGTVPGGLPCDYLRTDGDTECVFGEICVPGVTTSGQCLLIGDQPDGGHPCPAGQSYLRFLGDYDWAVCVQGCDGGAPCGPNQACRPVGPGNYCLPQ